MSELSEGLRDLREMFTKPASLPTSDEEWDLVCETLDLAAARLEALEAEFERMIANLRCCSL